jgi:ATP-dependent helicase/nuclease subunit A
MPKVSTMIERAGAALLAEDDDARRRARATGTSFLVQAPAGSGKTELLIQRYLALLACVDEPDQIVALTFTNKAAGEMRERVLGALLAAERGDPEPEEEHERVTRTLAIDALAQNRRRNWSITEHPSRLRMQTFDALATALARRAPLAAGLGPHPVYVEDATMLYRRAAEGALVRARADDASWRTLLLYFDNLAPLITTLIAGMLARRDQWLRQVTGVPLGQLRSELESALRAEIVDVLEHTRRAFPQGIGADIRARARDAAAVLAQREPGRDFANELLACAIAGGLPPADVESLPLWRTLARFLMVSDCKHFKRVVTIKDGFEPIGKYPGASDRRERKDAMESMLRSLDAVPGLASALAAASRMPEPRISDDAWRIVEALLDVLPKAVAELTSVVFAEERQIDFLQANLAAVDALGGPEDPSELLLRLDASVRHLLVDEFQDTSHVQLRLLERLTSDWAPGDGRTIFAVGDPMQSIYRFREAEVGFFLKAQDDGTVCGLPVERLTLRRNFRSQANIVDWCNDTFAPVLGGVRDAARGVVPFEPAAAARPPCDGSVPALELFENASGEAERVVALVRDAQAAGARDIAVLVRARAHLAQLLPALRRARVVFAAVELDLLSQRQVVLDLAALTHALLQPADRAAWLAVLRAPWCGLTLADLVAVGEAAGTQSRAAIPLAFENIEAIAGMSDDGRQRLRRVLDALLPTLDARGQASATDRVRGAWLALGGPACLDDPIDLDAAALYFDLLSAHERGGDLPDWDAFVATLSALHASPAATSAPTVQIMTMHKAKGLEFDTVILTGLAEEGRRSDPALLRWRRRDAGLLIAPARSRGGDIDPLYRYLERLDAEAENAELGRLLYVASTRAKTRLHLVAAPGTRVDKETGALGWKDPVRSSSLAKLAPALNPELPFVGRPVAVGPLAGEPPLLRRVPLDAAFAVPPDAVALAAPRGHRDLTSPPFDWARETTRCVGIVAHRLLAKIADEGPGAWPRERVVSLLPRVRADLAGAGFAPDELGPAASQVLEVIQRTLADPRGRWLFDAAHEDARSEWALSGVDGGEIVRVVVDRTFVANGERWVVDFKTGTHEGGDAKTFLDTEVERYRDQMTRYARLMRGMDPRPVRLALYYPLIEGGFREIDRDPLQFKLLLDVAPG